jgi:hypothetical protein
VDTKLTLPPVWMENADLVIPTLAVVAASVTGARAILLAALLLTGPSERALRCAAGSCVSVAARRDCVRKCRH